MKVNFLEANNGDCILVSYEYDGYKKNIMIDSGVSKTYEYKIGRLKKEGSLKKVILDLQEKDQNIDLWSFGLPLIGCGIAGGEWDEVREIIKSELSEFDVTIVHFNQ